MGVSIRAARRAPLVASMVLLGLLIVTGRASADQVVLKNGDKITGKVGEIAGGKMKFISPVLGDISIDMVNVESFSTDAPVNIRMKHNQPTVTDKVTTGTATDYKTEGGRDVPASDAKVFNPPSTKWTGSVLLTGSLVRGNSDTFDLGLDAAAVYRRDVPEINDRFTLGGQYHFGTTGTGDASTTTTDNWLILGKYDKFLTEKFYLYGMGKLEHDRIAALYYRATPGVGVGYQWYESPGFNFFTEAGPSYIHEEFDNDGTNDEVALRLAYHIDKKLNDTVGLFHNLEYLPAFEDPGDYLLTTDAGIRAELTKNFFSEFKVEWKHDATPAPDAQKNDTRFVLGVGWSF
jgi:putative salt-induced outer membrane protein YdiY